MSNDQLSTPDAQDQELARVREENTALQQRVADLEATVAAQAFDVAVGHTLRTAFSDSGVFVFDHELRYVAVNAPMLSRRGVDDTAMIGHTVWEVVPPDVVATVEHAYRAALQGEIGSFTTAFNGDVYRSVVAPVRDATGHILGGVALLREINAQVTAEQRLHMFEQLVEHAPDAMFIIDSTTQVIWYANPAAHRLLGWTAPLQEQPVTVILSPNGRAPVEQIGAQLAAHRAWQGRSEYQRVDGTTLPTSITVFPLINPTTKAPWVGSVGRDMTVEDQAAQAAQAEILAAQQAMIRELATPLIPLADAVIAMPLVGTIDQARAQQVLETLLEGIVTHQAEHAILDITGVRVVDTQVAQALVRIAQAAKLLGAQILLSGIGAEIALTLTQLDADLAGLIPVSNLQQALRYALTQRTIGTID